MRLLSSFMHHARNVCSVGFLMAFMMLVSTTDSVYAQTVSSTVRLPSDKGAGLINPLGATNVQEIIGRIIAGFGGIAGSLFFLYLVWGGVEWMMAGGDSKKVSDAQGRIKAAAMGIAVILLAYMLVASVIGLISG